jgi:hypothetical protein
MSDATVTAMAETITEKDAYLIDYLLGWAALGPEQPWGAAHSFALEMGYHYGLIRGESDPTPTAFGRAVAKAIEAQSAETGNTDSARRAKARSRRDLPKDNQAKESEGAE